MTSESGVPASDGELPKEVVKTSTVPADQLLAEPLAARVSSVGAHLDALDAQIALMENRWSSQRLSERRLREQLLKSKGETRAAVQTAQRDAAAVGDALQHANTLLSQFQAATATLQLTGEQCAEIRGQAASTLESAKAALQTIADASSRAESLRTSIEQAAEVSKSRSQHIEEGRLHSDEVRAKLDKSVSDSQQAVSAAESQLATLRALSETATALGETTRTAAEESKTAARQANLARDNCSEHQAALQQLVQIGQTASDRVAEYEKAIAALRSECEALQKRIESLLPGATSAGLASAFESRRAQFRAPQGWWQGAYIVAIVVLVSLAGWHLYSSTTQVVQDGWNHAAAVVVYRLPLVLPVVWFAMHAARQAGLAKRLEEEYAFKGTVSHSFEGYAKQMSEVDKQSGAPGCLPQLCKSTMEVIHKSPGRIYEKQRTDVTPMTAVSEVVEKLAPVVREAIEKVPK